MGRKRGKRSSQERKRGACSSDLPSDVWRQVLARLPVESLVRFRCICKTWCSLIDDPDFTKMHLAHFENNRVGSHLLMLYCDEKWDVEHIRSDMFKKTVELRVPFRCFQICGYVDGLILTKSSDKGLVLWNPSIEKWLVVPSSPTAMKRPWTQFFLGYDGCSDDYKVLAMTRECRSLFNDEDGNIQVEVFALKTGSWKALRHKNLSIRTWGEGVYLNGSIHWAGKPQSSFDGIGGQQLFLFDFSTELFHCTGNVPVKNVWSFRVFYERLALFEQRSPEHLDLLVMERYCDSESWTKLCTIPGRYFRVLKMSHEVLLSTGDKVISYDVTNQQIKDLATTKLSYMYFANTFIESLVLHKTSAFHDPADEASQ